MNDEIEFFFDFGSPNSYLAYTQLPAILARHDTRLVWRPILLGGVFKATGNHAPGEIKAKGTYLRQDMARFVTRYDIDYRHNDAFPINTIALMRGAVAFLGDARFEDYVDTMFKAMWVDNRNLGDADVLEKTLTDAGFDWGDFQNRIGDPAVKDALRQATDDAVARGVFGAPSFIVGDALFFGQDRLDFVEEAITP